MQHGKQIVGGQVNSVLALKYLQQDTVLELVPNGCTNDDEEIFGSGWARRTNGDLVDALMRGVAEADEGNTARQPVTLSMQSRAKVASRLPAAADWRWSFDAALDEDSQRVSGQLPNGSDNGLQPLCRRHPRLRLRWRRRNVVTSVHACSEERAQAGSGHSTLEARL